MGRHRPARASQHERAALEAALATRTSAPEQRRGAPSAFADRAPRRLGRARALRQESRERGVEGFMLKRLDARYGTGRTKRLAAAVVEVEDRSDELDCVLIYAQAGHGRRASVYTDYTFAVWNRAPVDKAEADAVLEAIAARGAGRSLSLQLVAFAKAYSGLTDEEFRRSTASSEDHAREVRSGAQRQAVPGVRAGLRGHQPQRRHKSGIAVRFPRCCGSATTSRCGRRTRWRSWRDCWRWRGHRHVPTRRDR